MTIWEYIDAMEESAEIEEALQRAQQALHAGGNLSNYPTKMMQNAPGPGLSPSTDKSLEEEVAQTKRIDEMTTEDYRRAIRKLDQKPWDKKA